ncbi:MAG TPA: hypothetical protein VEB42_12020 [Chitinophagaceae bacterium]|nr:hypothetical protein [Chitinophagaceae bacterium]
MPDLNKIDIDVDEVITAFGEHYINEGQNMDNLHMLPFEESDTKEAGTVIETDQTVLREANVEVQELLQQYQDDFTSKGGVGFKPVMIPLQNIKIDVGIIPHKLIKSWLGFLTNSGNDHETYPFIQWLVENYILKQAREDMEMKAIYKGVYAAPVEGTAGSPDKVMNGIEKLLNDLADLGAAADGIDPITTGDLSLLSATAFVTAIEDFWKSVPEKYRYNYSVDLNMSRAFRDKFKQGMRDKYNVNYQQTNQLLQLMDFENVSIAGRASMTNKKRIWTTPKFNLLLPVKGFSNKNAFDVQKENRKVKFLTDWWEGAGFVQPQLIWMNEAEVPV